MPFTPKLTPLTGEQRQLFETFVAMADRASDAGDDGPINALHELADAAGLAVEPNAEVAEADIIDTGVEIGLAAGSRGLTKVYRARHDSEVYYFARAELGLINDLGDLNRQHTCWKTIPAGPHVGAITGVCYLHKNHKGRCLPQPGTVIG